MTTTCPSRHTGFGATYNCDQPPGHTGPHQAHRDDKWVVGWADEVAEPREDTTTARTDHARRIDRGTLTLILNRLDRGKTLTSNERRLLRKVTAAEQADCDAARVEALATRDGIGQLRAEHEKRRTALIEAIELPDDAEWPRITQAAADLRRAATEATEATDRAERNARADVAAARQAEEQAERAEKAEQERDEAREAELDARNVHEGARLALSDALGLGTGAPWGALADRARELATTERYSFGAAGGLTPGGILTAAAVRDAVRRADGAERNARADVAAARQAEQQAGVTLATRHRQLADALGQPITTSWPDLIAAAFRAYRTADLLTGADRDRQNAERHLRDAEQRARDAERERDQARQERKDAEGRMCDRYGQLTRVLRLGPSSSWDDIVAVARDAVQQLAAARRDAADARIRAGHALADRNRYRDAWHNARRRARALHVEAAVCREDAETNARRAETAEATLARVRTAIQPLGPLSRQHIEKAVAQPPAGPCDCGQTDCTECIPVQCATHVDSHDCIDGTTRPYCRESCTGCTGTNAVPCPQNDARERNNQ